MTRAGEPRRVPGAFFLSVGRRALRALWSPRAPRELRVAKPRSARELGRGTDSDIAPNNSGWGRRSLHSLAGWGRSLGLGGAFYAEAAELGEELVGGLDAVLQRLDDQVQQTVVL